MGGMGQDRLSIDLRDLRERIVSARSDVAWRNLSMSAKVRTLIEIGLEHLNEERQPQTIAETVARYWDDILSKEPDISLKRLRAIRDGERPTDAELVELRAIVPIESVLEGSE